MLLSIALILLVGMSMGWICKKIKLPSLLGMMITGMILGPYVLNLLDDSILGISAELRKIALIIILTSVIAILHTVSPSFTFRAALSAVIKFAFSMFLSAPLLFILEKTVL